MLLNEADSAIMAKVQRDLYYHTLELSRYFRNAHYNRHFKTGFEVESPKGLDYEGLMENFYRISKREMEEAGV